MKTPSRDSPIGVFDSGLGGLTVARALRRVMPSEDILYLGDTARVPYGTKAPETVVKYALGCSRYLVQRGVKALVIACNTVSAVAPSKLRAEFTVPVLEVVEPGATAAVGATKTGRIGVLATAGTVASEAYPRAVAKLLPTATVVAQAAPLLVPLAEEGWTEGDVPKLAIRRYLEPLARANVDVVVLGCTHYPLLFPLIESEARALIGPHVRVIDSAEAIAHTVRDFLVKAELSRPETGGGRIALTVTDIPKTFREVASRFLGEPVAEVDQIDLQAAP